MTANSVRDKLILIGHFIRARHRRFTHREELENWQQTQLQDYLEHQVIKASYYQNFSGKPLADYPLMDKSQMMENFAGRNTENIALDTVLPIAMSAENSRDFNPQWKGFTVGLSSGTSGKRGVFLVSKQERLRWAGILLAKTLPNRFLWQIIKPWQPKLSIAFFLRANSNLYNTLNSSRIDFRFYDLLQPLDQHILHLNQFPPQVLVAPASILQALAKAQEAGSLTINPQRIINVAEVLEADVAQEIEKAFAQKVHQIYQATEGFLAYTCEQGNLHLNETYIHIEKNWLDNEKKRFQPIITDFTRSTQIILRYQLNDVLRVADQPCSCGNAETCITAIEGRSDEIFWLPEKKSQELKPIYPDSLRRCMMLVEPELQEYKIIQRGRNWEIAIKTQVDIEICKQSIENNITHLCENFGLIKPQLTFSDWHPEIKGAKRRRLVCESTK
jgi:putative adenylate-forming enzyme